MNVMCVLCVCCVCVVCVFEGLGVGGGDIVTVTAVNAKYSQQSRWIISGWSMVKLLSYFYQVRKIKGVGQTLRIT